MTTATRALRACCLIVTLDPMRRVVDEVLRGPIAVLHGPPRRVPAVLDGLRNRCFHVHSLLGDMRQLFFGLASRRTRLVRSSLRIR
jgi:hypothetical protein